MSDPQPARWKRVLVFLLNAAPLAFRLALVLTALLLLFHGARRIYDPAGYIVVGALLWLEVARRPPRPPAAPEGS